MDDGRLDLERAERRSANLGFLYRPASEPVERMYAAAFDLLAAMHRAAGKGGTRFLLLVHPRRFQVQPRDWEVMTRHWNLRDADFDLELVNRRIAVYCRERGIDCCDLLDSFRRKAASGQGLYLPAGDTHYNRHGHEAAAEAAAECLARLGLP